MLAQLVAGGAYVWERFASDDLIVLLTVGLLRPRTGYRWMSAAAAAGWSGCLGVRTGLDAPNPLAVGAVLTAFSLLAAGATISWHKQRWLRFVGSAPPATGNAEATATPPGEPTA